MDNKNMGVNTIKEGFSGEFCGPHPILGSILINRDSSF